MANNKKTKTAAPAAKKPAEAASASVEVIDVNKLNQQLNSKSDTGLDANHQVDLLNGLKTFFHDDPNAKTRFGEAVVEKIDGITAIGFVTVLVNEIVSAKTPFAVKMSSAQLGAITEVAPMLGIQIDAKLLPAPNADGTVQVPSNAVIVSKETKEKVKKEKAVVEEKPTTDPSKITNDEQLKKSLVFILCDTSASTRPYDRMIRATEFFRSVRSLEASKLADADESKTKLAEIKAKSVSDILEDMRLLIGECPFSTVGLAHYVFNQARETRNPISPFIILYRSSRNKTTNAGLEDSTVAAIVKVLVNWNVDESLKEYEVAYKRHEKIVKDSSESTRKNMLEPIQKNIDYCKSIKECISHPNFDAVESLIDDFKGEDVKKKNKATFIVRNIIDLWMPDVKFDELESNEKKDEILENVKKRAGVIVNAFLDPLEQNIAYKEFSTATSAEKKEEEQSKN
mgnify:FL=1